MAARAIDTARTFLGVGWAFPPRLEPDGAIARAELEADIRESIRIILGTEPGERVMRPDFGAGLRAFVFEPVSTTTMARLEVTVRDSLIAWEARIDLESVVVTTNVGERNALLIDVTYRVRATNAVRNLVYPFYLEEGTAE